MCADIYKKSTCVSQLLPQWINNAFSHWIVVNSPTFLHCFGFRFLFFEGCKARVKMYECDKIKRWTTKSCVYHTVFTLHFSHQSTILMFYKPPLKKLGANKINSETYQTAQTAWLFTIFMTFGKFGNLKWQQIFLSWCSLKKNTQSSSQWRKYP